MDSSTLLLTLLVGSILFQILVLGVLLWRTSARSRGAAEQVLREELRAGRVESGEAARELRQEVVDGMRGSAESLTMTLGEMGMLQKAQTDVVIDRLRGLTEANEARLERFRETLESQLRRLEESNQEKLDEMRRTVDEKLQDTLEKRLGESFQRVSERLEAVQRGLGEMQTLATGVGDLKRVLVNVKARGTWGEVQLGAILEQILTAEQYQANVRTKAGSKDHVEFAVRLPASDGDGIWLPIDSKFPQEDYLRLQAAAEEGDSAGVQQGVAALARSVRLSAQQISAKYLDPPRTTDFALLFLPTEGLYAEVLRIPGLLEDLQASHRVTVAGPTTLGALLNSLRLGFRTLAIEQRASEVWQILAAVKTEFRRFGGVLDKVKKQLDTATRTLDQTGVRTRAMERKLREVESLPAGEAEELLELEPRGEG